MDEDIIDNSNECDFYKQDYREELIDDDELSPEEEGFMKGYDDADEVDK